MELPNQVRSLLGAEVDVETVAGTLHGLLLSFTRQSLWLVAGEDDLLVPVASVRSVHRPTAA
jgi:hypothetical protein